MAEPPSCKFVKVVHGNEGHFVAMFSGLPSSELAGVLGAAFGVDPSTIIGITDRTNRAVIPLSLASRAPETLTGEGHEYELLLSKGGSSALPPPPSGTLLPSAPAVLSADEAIEHEMYTAVMSAAPPSPPPMYAVQDQQPSRAPVHWSSAGNDDSVEAGSSVGAVAPSTESEMDQDLIRILVAFASKLCAHGMLTPAQADAVCEMIQTNDTVVFAAYKVSEWKQVSGSKLQG